MQGTAVREETRLGMEQTGLLKVLSQCNNKTTAQQSAFQTPREPSTNQPGFTEEDVYSLWNGLGQE